MSFIKKHYFPIFAIAIALLFFITRLYNILSLPIFTDEAIYIRWSQIAGTDANWRFISLTDGKQPMYVWITMIALKIIKDPLLAGRLVSTGAGLLSTVGLFFLASELFKNKKIGIVTSLIYVLFPFALIYDRLALYDSLVAASMIWALYFEVLLVRKMRLDIAMILGMVIGFGMLTKTSADFALILLPFSLLLFNFMEKPIYKNIGIWIVFAIVSAGISEAMYLVLRLSPFYHIINEKNYTFIYSPREFLISPFAHLSGNLTGLLGWLIEYGTIPFLLLVISSFLVSRKYFYEKLLLFIWFILPFIGLALFGKVIYPRFILFMVMPLIVLSGYTLFNMVLFAREIYLKIIIVVVFLLMFVVNDFFILTNFAKASIPPADKNQLIASWPSGVGVKETVEYLKEQSINQKIYVGTEGTFGLMPYSLEIYFHNNPNVKTQGFWSINNTPPKEVLESAKKMPTYFVFYQPCPSCSQTGIAPQTWPLKQIFQIPKIEKGSFYTLYQVIPQ